MKMATEAFERLRSAVAPLDTEDARARYAARDFPRAEHVKDIDKRYRWDLLNAACGHRFACEQYDAGLSDAHIDTALRHIVAPLKVTS